MSKKKKHEGEHENAERWLLTYADLITLLLGLFVILYAMSKVDQNKFQEFAAALNHAFGGKTIMSGNEGITTMPSHLSQNESDDNADENSLARNQNDVEKKINEVLEQYVKMAKIDIVRSSNGMTIHLLDTLLFETGQAILKPEAKVLLSKLSVSLRNIPNEIMVEGHTDNVPINTSQFPSNWHLSVARSLNTAYYMMQNGINPNKISIAGYSEYRPVATNEDPEGRAKNRRVDIVIKNLDKNNQLFKVAPDKINPPSLTSLK